MSSQSFDLFWAIQLSLAMAIVEFNHSISSSVQVWLGEWYWIKRQNLARAHAEAQTSRATTCPWVAVEINWAQIKTTRLKLNHFPWNPHRASHVLFHFDMCHNFFHCFHSVRQSHDKWIGKAAGPKQNVRSYRFRTHAFWKTWKFKPLNIQFLHEEVRTSNLWQSKTRERKWRILTACVHRCFQQFNLCIITEMDMGADFGVANSWQKVQKVATPRMSYTSI